MSGVFKIFERSDVPERRRQNVLARTVQKGDLLRVTRKYEGVFENGQHWTDWSPDMDSTVDQIGIVLAYDRKRKLIRLEIGPDDDRWWYPPGCLEPV